MDVLRPRMRFSGTVIRRFFESLFLTLRNYSPAFARKSLGICGRWEGEFGDYWPGSGYLSIDES
jgi:hypothetical protein